MLIFRKSFLKKIITTIALIVLNTLILFVCLEIFLWISRCVRDTIQSKSLPPRPIFYNVLDLEYVPWVQFKSVEHKSAHTNVEGFLRKSQPDSCGNFKKGESGINDIYFFGGSTMFGGNVADGETIPSHFVTILGSKNENVKARVWNYGHPYYYSTQEMFLLFSLIAEGKRPKTVIFLDGLNDVLQLSSSYYRYPFFTPSLKKMFLSGRPKTSYLLSALFQKTNLYRVLRYVRNKLTHNERLNIWDLSYGPPAGVSEDGCAKKIAENYLDMIKTTQTLCKTFNIKCYFFWQPVPYYNYDRSKDKICDQRSFSMFAKIYPVIKERARYTQGLYYLGDLLSEYNESAFVDWCHYSSTFNRRIADEILKVIFTPNGTN